MLPHGTDRLRLSGEKVILFSRLPKGWKPRVAKTRTSAEHPGTAVLWDEEIFEVVQAEPSPAGGVRYLLEPWREEHAMRQVERYDDESEARLAADWGKARAQRQLSVSARLSGMLLGHLPRPVQDHLAKELGVSAASMTLLSAIPEIVFLGVCFWITAEATMEMKASPLPGWVWPLIVLTLFDAGVRFFVAMSQSRAMGSVFGMLLYTLVWLAAPSRWNLVSPFAQPGERFFMIDPSAEVAGRDAMEMRAPLLTLLDPADQALLAQRYGFDYRRTAAPVAWVLLVASLAGIVSLRGRVFEDHAFSALLSVTLAAAVAYDQVRRLPLLRRGPAGSIFAPLLRRFARDLLGE